MVFIAIQASRGGANYRIRYDLSIYIHSYRFGRVYLSRLSFIKWLGCDKSPSVFKTTALQEQKNDIPHMCVVEQYDSNMEGLRLSQSAESHDI